MAFTPLNFRKLTSSNTPQLRFLIIGSVLAFIILAATSLYFYSKYRQTQNKLKQESRIPKDEARYLLSLIGKLMDLPEDEIPTIGTVKEKKDLPSQPFYKKAENGDKILLYEKAKKAILYRPRLNKIIEVAPLNIVPTQTATSEGLITPAGRIIFRGVTRTPTLQSATSSAEY